MASPPIGIAGMDSGRPSHETCPKCTTEMGVTTSQTAMQETKSPRTEATSASRTESGASSESPYHRRPSGVAAQRRARTAAKVNWNPGSAIASGSATNRARAATPSSDIERCRRPNDSALALATATRPARATLGSSSTTTRYANASMPVTTAVIRHGPPNPRSTIDAPRPSTAKLKPEIATRCDSPLRAK